MHESAEFFPPLFCFSIFGLLKKTKRERCGAEREDDEVEECSTRSRKENEEAE
jgi:hypothetical protein